jgi:hypothetical protein
MYSTSGTTNGFRFSESLLGQSHADASPNVVIVPISNGKSYAVNRRAAKRTAKKYGAFGFWRVKRHG